MKNLTKYIGLALAIATGIIIGILIGYQILGDQGEVVAANKLPGDLGVPDEMKLNFGLGDQFPLIELETINGDKIEIGQLLNWKKTGVLITALRCSPCDDFLNQWNQLVTPKLKKDAQEILLITHEDLINTKDLPKFVNNKHVFHFFRKELEDKINAAYFPTALAVDENGKVIGVQYGKQEGINYEILKFLTTHDI